VLRQILNREGMNKLSPSWEGPFQVTRVCCPGCVRLATGDGEPVPRPWVQWQDYSFPYVVIVPRSGAKNSRAPAGPVSPCHPEWAATSMNRPVFSYVKKLYGNFYLALYALLLLIYPSIFCYIHVLHYLALLLSPRFVHPIH
jgi:hypothetical protein